MWRLPCPEAKRDAGRRAIKLLNGRYYYDALREVFYATVLPETGPPTMRTEATRLSPREAADELCRSAERVPMKWRGTDGGKHPFTSSWGWGMPRVEKDLSRWVNVGMGPRGPDLITQTMAVAKHHGLLRELGIYGAAHPCSYLDIKMPCKFKPWWSRQKRKEVVADFQLGDWMDHPSELIFDNYSGDGERKIMVFETAESLDTT
jgi:hypothetical protein